MSLATNKYYLAYKKHERLIGAIEGILIILLIGYLCYFAYKDIQLQKDVSEDCGWGTETYYCMCEKSAVAALRSQMDKQTQGALYQDINYSAGVSNVSLAIGSFQESSN